MNTWEVCLGFRPITVSVLLLSVPSIANAGKELILYSFAIVGSISGSIIWYSKGNLVDLRFNSINKSSVFLRAALSNAVSLVKNAVILIGSLIFSNILTTWSSKTNCLVAVVSVLNHSEGSVLLVAQKIDIFPTIKIAITIKKITVTK